MAQLNCHYLKCFREVAAESHLGRTAHRLNISQSALSTQIKLQEDRLGHAFFDRVGQSLVLPKQDVSRWTTPNEYLAQATKRWRH